MPQPKGKRRSTDVVTVTRERLQEIVDDAVQRGRMTRTDATDLITEIFSRSRNTTEDIVDRARRATGLGTAFPIANYERLTAAEVQTRLDKLSPAELRKVRDYERRNANRKTVLAAIESKLP
jgi:polyhydroxyalkanoate synthesis regulator phasin